MIRTKHQAELEARRRGWHEGNAHGDLELREERNGTKVIGVLHNIGGLRMRTVKTSGRTWQEAFDKYDRGVRRRAIFEDAKDQPCPWCFRTMRAGYGPQIFDPKKRDPKRNDHWPTVVEIDGKEFALCIACERTTVAKAIVAMGEAIGRMWYVSGAEFVATVHKELPDAFAELPEDMQR